MWAYEAVSSERVVSVEDQHFSPEHFFDLKEDIFDKNRVNFNKGWLGIFMENQEGRGVRVEGVIKGSPAHTCGLQNGDIITNVNGSELNGDGDENLIRFKRSMESSGSGSILRLTVLRGESELEVQPRLSAKLLNTVNGNGQSQKYLSPSSFVMGEIREREEERCFNEKESFLSFILQDEEFRDQYLQTMQRIGEETFVRESYHADSGTNLFRLSLIDQLMSHPLDLPYYGEIIHDQLIKRSLILPISYAARLLDLMPNELIEREQTSIPKRSVQERDDGVQRDSVELKNSFQKLVEDMMGALFKGLEMRNGSLKKLTQSELSQLYNTSHRLWLHSETVEPETVEQFLETVLKVDLSLLMMSSLTVIESIPLQRFQSMESDSMKLRPLEISNTRVLFDKMSTSDKGNGRQESIRGLGVGGDVLFIQEVKEIGIVVVGGPETTYYYDDAAVIIDTGGDDYYFNNAGASRDDAPISVSIDLSGNDTYISQKGYCQGTAHFGTGILLDFDGDDRYMGEDFCQGFGLFGVGLLYDERGEDSYNGDILCQGGGSFGSGLLRDYHGNDTYMSRMFSQGVGFTKGVGGLIDLEGDDLYFVGAKYADFRAPERSSQTLGQGFGFGMRPNNMTAGASGGIGVLIDEEGNDTYHGDYFAQGSSYYFSLGILYDKSGYDQYSAGRYSQGAGIHSSVGFLKDGGGDDIYQTYFGMSQGCGYDTGIGYLVDIDGNDFYKSNIISQGVGYEKGFGILSDFGGDDHYSADEGSQGFSYPSRNETFYGIGILSNIGGESDIFAGEWEKDTVLYKANAGILMNKCSGK